MLESNQNITLTVGRSGHITLPPEALDALNIATGDKLILSLEGAKLMLHAAKLKHDRLKALREIQAQMSELIPPNVDMVKELLQERRAEFKREKAKYARMLKKPSKKPSRKPAK